MGGHCARADIEPCRHRDRRYRAWSDLRRRVFCRRPPGEAFVDRADRHQPNRRAHDFALFSRGPGRGSQADQHGRVTDRFRHRPGRLCRLSGARQMGSGLIRRVFPRVLPRAFDPRDRATRKYDLWTQYHADEHGRAGAGLAAHHCGLDRHRYSGSLSGRDHARDHRRGDRVGPDHCRAGLPPIATPGCCRSHFQACRAFCAARGGRRSVASHSDHNAAPLHCLGQQQPHSLAVAGFFSC